MAALDPYTYSPNEPVIDLAPAWKDVSREILLRLLNRVDLPDLPTRSLNMYIFIFGMGNLRVLRKTRDYQAHAHSL
jgi:hypothetical protein